MKNKYKALAFGCAIALVSSAAVAGVLESQWTEGTKRFCKYSDGVVVTISYGAACSSTN